MRPPYEISSRFPGHRSDSICKVNIMFHKDFLALRRFMWERCFHGHTKILVIIIDPPEIVEDLESGRETTVSKGHHSFFWDSDSFVHYTKEIFAGGLFGI